MPAKNTNGDVAVSSRRSGRLAGDEAPDLPRADEQVGAKKRPAESKSKPAPTKKQKPEPPSKGTKVPTASKSKPAKSEPAKSEPAKSNTKSKSKSKEDKADTSSDSEEAAAAEEEAKASAPKSAKADTGGKGVLKLGDGLPGIILVGNDGEDVDVSTLAGERGVVLFLYPKADTPGCTNQACGFRDAYDEFDGLGYDIYGLSKDKKEAQQKWINKKDLNYKLLCDPESKLIKRLGAFVQPNNTKRSHFIFEKGTGKLVDIQLGVKPADDPKNCLKFLKQHHKEDE